MSAYAIVVSGMVSNVVAWDGSSSWVPPSGSTVVLLPAGSPVGQGYTYDGTNFTAPVVQISLADAQTSQDAVIDMAYSAAIQASVSFKTAAGVTETFQADNDSQDVLMKAVQGYQMAGSVPAGFYWKAADNTLVPFTLADLEGLYGTILAQGWAAFQKRTTLKAQISAASTVAAVQAVVWS